MSALGVVLLVAALAALAGLAYYAYVIKPLRRIEAAARSLARGDFSARTETPSGPLRRVAESLNATAASVASAVAAASQERGRLAAALNSSVDAFAALDRDGRVLFANVALEQLFYRRADEVVGQPFVWLLADEKVMDAFRASRDTGARRESLIERPGKQYLQVVTTPIANGGEWAVLAVFHDLTDVKRTEEVRRDFVANVSHELRTPLAGIKAVVETLADGAVNDPAVAADFLKRADADVDRLVQMVEELLELSRIESGDIPLALAPTDVGALLASTVERLRPQAERRNQTLTLDASDLGTAELDGARIERAVLNLVQNAIKFTPDGGSVTVAAQRTPEAIVVRVSDRGSGIDPDDLPRIFERFYKADQSRASGGSGLGLALVRHAVESHGGTVQAESRLGEGSTFTMTLPIRR
jgi:two-component system phosphate regulon sensor histidine kinase PhoR